MNKMVLDFNKEAKRLMAAKITQTIFEYTGSNANIPTDEVLNEMDLNELKGLYAAFAEGKVQIEHVASID